MVVQVIGAPVAAALLLMEGAGGLHGWQWLFILEGAVTVVYAAILAVRDTCSGTYIAWCKTGASHLSKSCPAQMNLAATPRTAAFLSKEEQHWVHDRQTQALVAKEAEAARSGNAWGVHLTKASVLPAILPHVT